MAATSKARGSAGRRMLAASFIALAGVSSADAREPVRTEQELIERVRAAIGDKDLELDLRAGQLGGRRPDAAPDRHLPDQTMRWGGR